jgi:hypothetical protein
MGLSAEKKISKDPHGKWTSNCERSNAVKNVFSDKALSITTMNGEELLLLAYSDAVN